MLGSGSVAKGSSSSSKLPKYSTSNRGSVDRSRLPWFISLLVAVKVCSSLATFMLADFLGSVSKDSGITHTHEIISNGHSNPTEEGTGIGTKASGFFGGWSPLLQTLAFIQLTSGVIYLVVQKPLSARGSKSEISNWQWFRIFRHAVISVIFLSTWSYGLLLSGPFRTTFLSCHYDFTLAGILSGFFVAKSGPRLRGGVLFVAGVLVLLLFDDAATFEGNHHRSRRSIEMEEQSFLSKNSVGIMTLIFCLLFKLGFDAFSKNLAADLGGLKRLHALSTFTSGLILVALVFIDFITGGSMIPIWSSFISLVFIILFGFVLNYYVDTICMKRMETSHVARIGTTASQFSALIYSLIWVSSNETPTVATLISFILIYVGTLSLTTSERASGGGSLVGYSSDGLPLFNFSSHLSGENYMPLWKNLLRLAISFYKQIQEDSMSRRIFYFFVLTLTFTGVEFLYGALANSLGLITDGFHMLFDAMAIFIGLCAAVMGRWKPSRTFPFGYGRLEVLSGFLNALFLMVVAGAICIEAWVRLLDPPSVDTHRLLPISIVGLIVNLVGIYAFHNGSSHSHAHDNANVRGVFLHILADTMGSIGVIISSLLIKYFGILIADPICSLVIAVLIVLSSVPLLKDTARILLLTVPEGIERNLQQAVLQILAMEGIKGYKAPRFWTHAPHILTGSIHIQASLDANEQQIIRHVNNLFSSIGFSHFTTQVEKDEFISRRNLGDEDDPSFPGEGRGSSGIGGLAISSNNSTVENGGPKRQNDARFEIDLV